jgi:hypothetical protein
MKKLFKPFLFLTIMLVFAGCKKETYSLNEEFTLKFNKSALIGVNGEKYNIKFTKLEEDSRCPPDVYCYWMGQVAVKVTLENEKDFMVGHHTTIQPTAEYKGHTIQLLEVNYDKDKHFGKEKHSTIKLRVD